MLSHRRVDAQLVERALLVLIECDPIRRPHALRHLQRGTQPLGVAIDDGSGGVIQRTVQELVLINEVAVQTGSHPQLELGVKRVVGDRA